MILFFSSTEVLGETQWLYGLDGRNDMGPFLIKLTGDAATKELVIKEWPDKE